MNVEQLLKILEKQDPETEVVIQLQSDLEDDLNDIECVKFLPPDEDVDAYVVLVME